MCLAKHTGKLLMIRWWLPSCLPILPCAVDASRSLQSAQRKLQVYTKVNGCYARNYQCHWCIQPVVLNHRSRHYVRHYLHDFRSHFRLQLHGVGSTLGKDRSFQSHEWAFKRKTVTCMHPASCHSRQTPTVAGRQYELKVLNGEAWPLGQQQRACSAYTYFKRNELAPCLT